MKNKSMRIAVAAAMMAAVGSMTILAASPVVGPGVTASETQNPGPGGAVGPGLANPGVFDQGAIGTEIPQPEIPGRVDYFKETVANPTVTIVERYSYDQMVQDIQNLGARYGGKMQTNVIGTSLDGRSIYEVVLGNPNAEKHVLIHAGIHARESMTPLLVMKQLEYGLEFYDTGSYEGQPLSNILNQVAIHFVPMTNPDGTMLSMFGVSAIRSEELRQMIQNCYNTDVAQGRTSASFERYLLYWKANARGVDLNQNFPAGWDQVNSSQYPSYATFKGTAPLSEPETQALATLVESRAWHATISYHSMGNIIYWDYPGNKQYERSRELVDLIATNTGYRPAGSSGHGGFKDWTQIKDNPVAGLTIETGSVACPLPLSEYSKLWNQNKMVWAAVGKYVMEH